MYDRKMNVERAAQTQTPRTDKMGERRASARARRRERERDRKGSRLDDLCAWPRQAELQNIFTTSFERKWWVYYNITAKWRGEKLSRSAFCFILLSIFTHNKYNSKSKSCQCCNLYLYYPLTRNSNIQKLVTVPINWNF